MASGKGPSIFRAVILGNFLFIQRLRCGLASVSSVFITSASAWDRRPSSPSSSLPGPLGNLQGGAEGQLHPKSPPNPTLLVYLWGN